MLQQCGKGTAGSCAEALPAAACRARRAIWQLRKHGVPCRLELRDTGSCGMGVFALEPIPGGTPLVEYLGEMITEEEVGACGGAGHSVRRSVCCAVLCWRCAQNVLCSHLCCDCLEVLHACALPGDSYRGCVAADASTAPWMCMQEVRRRELYHKQQWHYLMTINHIHKAPAQGQQAAGQQQQKAAAAQQADDAELVAIDATYVGNISRFVNHMCGSAATCCVQAVCRGGRPPLHRCCHCYCHSAVRYVSAACAKEA